MNAVDLAEEKKWSESIALWDQLLKKYPNCPALVLRRALAEAVLAALRPCCGAASGVHVQCCVETLEIDRASYAKESFIAE